MTTDEKQLLEKENALMKAELRALTAAKEGYVQSEEIDLREIWAAIWGGKWLIIFITFLFSTAAVIIALSIPNEYRSTAILAPASQSKGGGLASLASQFGGLASLAGVSLGGGVAEDKSLVAIEVMKTWGFLEKFIEDNNIQAELFAVKGWNRLTKELVFDENIYDSENKVWIRDYDPSKGETPEPSSWELYKELNARININQDKATGLINLTVDHYSPEVAKIWVDKLIIAINQHIQEQDKSEANESIAYLSEKIQETKIADMKSVFYKLIEEQTKTLMLTEVSKEYVLKTLSKAKVAEEKSKPKRGIICILGFLLGVLLSVSVVLVKYFVNINKKESR